VALGSTLCFLLFDLTAGPGVAHPIGMAMVGLGAGLTFVAVGCLGRCYGVFPACRGVRTEWLYRVVRHPIYASYLLTDLGYLLAFPSAWNGGVVALGAGLYLWRIAYEEALLGRQAAYRRYRAAVPWRLVPHVY
jgi:protein-S-isoprenylcysteine O-methyltransferase Ste14